VSNPQTNKPSILTGTVGRVERDMQWHGSEVTFLLVVGNTESKFCL